MTRRVETTDREGHVAQPARMMSSSAPPDVSSVIRGDAWGSGATWTLEAFPAPLGADDDPAAFVPRHETVARAHRKHAGLRLPRTGLVM